MLNGVVANVSFWRGLEREGEGNGEVLRAVAIVNDAESQCAGPAPQVAIDRVKLLLQAAVLGVEIVPHANPPVVIQPVKKRAGDEIVALGKSIKSAAQIPVADAPAPSFAGRQRELMKGQVQIAAVDVVTQLRFERNPGARAKDEVGIKIAERLLLAERFVEIVLIVARGEPPIQRHVPIEQIVELAVAFGLERVAQAETNHILAVNGINVVVIGKLNRQQQQAGRRGIELGQLRQRCGGSRHENVIHRRLKDVAQAVNVQK